MSPNPSNNKPRRQSKATTSKTRTPRKSSTPDPERTVEVAENTVSKMQGKKDATEIKVETPKANNLVKPKVGADKPIGRSPNYVTSVGLGRLKVTTANGNTDV